ncbi:hypothetical protein H9Y04_01795 [Streptomyces sp. TRM66268-LWL]|uniref:RDD family protein n=1 Tax=Streptomyces polyasparticus TaxID=2767826 RepID=A0ABR7S852_9ACTN|nr:hypothetical protein [Streptomyces polyasparticus]MBC9711304.1 hypothetical protein [Streptomyces polyasparticus]
MARKTYVTKDLVRCVPMRRRLCAAALVATAVIEVIAFATADGLGFEGTGRLAQTCVAAGLPVLFALVDLLGRRRQVRAFADAVQIVPVRALLAREGEQRRLLRKTSLFGVGVGVMFSQTLAIQVDWPIAALGCPAALLIALVGNERIRAWERRNGVHLWVFPPTVSWGQDDKRGYYSTPAVEPAVRQGAR